MFVNVFAIGLMRYLFRIGLAPKGAVIRKALAALKKDELGLAVDTYLDLARANYSVDKVQVLHEILVSELNFRLKVLNERIDSLGREDTPGSDSEIKNCMDAKKLLKGYLLRLGIGMREIR